MDRNFRRSLEIVLKHEGGFVNLKADPGGATNMGITIGTFRKYIKPGGTVEDLKKLTREQAAICYRKKYWDAISGAELPDGVDLVVFDFAVNSGPDRAAKYLQAIVGVPEDGKIGPATLKAVRGRMHAGIINLYSDKRLAFLKGLKTWPTFGKGWAARVKATRIDALDMATRPTPENPAIIEKKVIEEKPVVPVAVDTQVKQKTNQSGWLIGIFGSIGTALTGLFGQDWQTVVAVGGVAIVALVLLLLLRHQIISAVKDIRGAVEE
jgi:lysozyme family protein